MTVEMLSKFLIPEDFGSAKFLGDDPDIQLLTPKERAYVSAWRHACPRPDEVINYYGNRWLEAWRQDERNFELPEPTVEEIEAHGIAMTRRRYDECDFVTEWVVEQVRNRGESKTELLKALTSPVERLPGELAGYREPGRVPESHEHQMSRLSTLFGFALARVGIEQFGWEVAPRTWERYERGLDAIDRAIDISNTPHELVANLAKLVTEMDAEPDRVLGHSFELGIREEEHNFTEFDVMTKTFAENAPVLYARYIQSLL